MAGSSSFISSRISSERDERRERRQREALRRDSGVVPRQVLIVGDSPGLCVALERALRHPALCLRTAETRYAGLSILARESIDFVIADLRLEAGAGINFLASVKRDFPRTSRVLITGECDVALLRDAIRRSGVSFFLGKPWDAHSLWELQRNLLLVDCPVHGGGCGSAFPEECAGWLLESQAFEALPRPECSAVVQARGRAGENFAGCWSESGLPSRSSKF